MNIQFITNGIPTGEVDWEGRPRCRYIPDWVTMRDNATCEDEVRAILQAQLMYQAGRTVGFAFPIVYTAPVTVNGITTWEVLQHPWYREDGGPLWSKARMIKDIEEGLKSL